MSTKPKNRTSWIAPLVALALLGGLAMETYSRPTPADAEPYHRRVAEIAKDLPMRIGDWEGREIPTTPEAIRLLKPNVIFTREFTRTLNDGTRERATLLLVHCKDARDIYGHYPPVCYPSHGYKPTGAEPVRQFDWEVDGVMFTGTEYRFTAGRLGDNRMVVENFILLPDGRIVRDMKEVGKSASDYLRRFFGASQVQVVFKDGFAEDDPQKRREIFTELVTGYMPVIQAIRTGAKQDEQ